MIQFEHITFTYPGAERAALRDISLNIPAGDMALVVGRSGSGKSTLLRCINGLVPHFSGGKLEGDIRVAGYNPVEATPKVMSRHVGFVFQDPETQFVLDRVEDEIAFALENQAMPRDEMRGSVETALSLMELTTLRDRRLETLSGGERQRVAIAGSLVLRPQVLVLDEPTSQLDPQGAEEVLTALLRLKRDSGLTVVLVEHRLERVLPFIDRLIYLDDHLPGVISGPPREILAEIDFNSPLVTLAKGMGWYPLPLSIEEAGKFTAGERKVHPGDRFKDNNSLPSMEPVLREPFIQVEDLTVNYGNKTVLKEISMDLYPGEITVLMGPNGVGKTTLLRVLVGLQKPASGRVLIGGEDIAGRDVAEVSRQVAYLPQNPNALLFSDTVLDELLLTLHNRGIFEGVQDMAMSLLEQLGLADKAGLYPRDLSAGERQRIALGVVMVAKPGALLLDEPTRGLDYEAKARLTELLFDWRDQGIAVLMVTHDTELAAIAAERVMLMHAGRIGADGVPAGVLGHSDTFAPQIARLYPQRGWLTARDALLGLVSPHT